MTAGLDPAGELVALAAWIDQQLAGGIVGRQPVAESASARLKDVALEVTGAVEVGRAAALGPFETSREVMDHWHPGARPRHGTGAGGARHLRRGPQRE